MSYITQNNGFYFFKKLFHFFTGGVVISFFTTRKKRRVTLKNNKVAVSFLKSIFISRVGRHVYINIVFNIFMSYCNSKCLCRTDVYDNVHLVFENKSFSFVCLLFQRFQKSMHLSRSTCTTCCVTGSETSIYSFIYLVI